MAIDGSLGKLITHIETHQKKKLRNARIEIIVLALLTIVTAVYTSVVYKQTKTITPSQIASLVGSHVAKSIPNYKEKFKGQLIEKAPSFIDRGKRLILNGPTQIREELTSHTAVSVAELSVAFDDILMRLMTKSFEKGWVEIEKTIPDANYQRKVDYLLNVAQKDFSVQIEGAMDEAYAKFAVNVNKFKKNLKRLHNEPQSLSPTEKIYKEILQIWAVICKKYGLID